MGSYIDFEGVKYYDFINFCIGLVIGPRLAVFVEDQCSWPRTYNLANTEIAINNSFIDSGLYVQAKLAQKEVTAQPSIMSRNSYIRRAL